MYSQDIGYCRSRGGGNPALENPAGMTQNVEVNRVLSDALPELFHGLDSRLRGNDTSWQA